MTDPSTTAPVPAPVSPSPLVPTASANTVNYRALTEPVTKPQVRLFRAQTKAAQRADPSLATGLSTTTTVASIVGLTIAGVVFLPLVLFTLIGVVSTAASGAGGGGAAIALVAFLLVGLGLVALVVILVIHNSDGNWTLWMRLTQFATDNGLRFRTRSPNPSYQGMIFHVGDSRFAYNHLNSITGRFFDVGSFQYGTGSGKSREIHKWGFIALQLDRRLPNMVLDAKANNGIFGMSNLPVTLSKDQILSLEGDFNEHFTLYCPKEYETDALYVFTPDLMALLIDDADAFDVEIVDDWMFVYSRAPFTLLNPAMMARIFSIIGTVGTKTVTQTENYHDDRVGTFASNLVAPQGQRLRHSVSLAAIIIIVVVVGGWLFGTVSSLGIFAQ